MTVLMPFDNVRYIGRLDISKKELGEVVQKLPGGKLVVAFGKDGFIVHESSLLYVPPKKKAEFLATDEAPSEAKEVEVQKLRKSNKKRFDKNQTDESMDF